MPQANDFLAGVLGSRSTNFEPQRSNHAMLYITNCDFAPGVNGTETLRLALQSFPLPKNETNITMIPYLNEVRKFSGQTMVSDMQVAFHDYVSRDVLSVLWSWRYKVYDPRTGIRGLKADYARNGYIEVFAPDNSLVLTYTLEGIWPAAIEMGDIDYGSDEPMRIGINFAVDKAYLQNDAFNASLKLIEKNQGSGG